MWVALRISRDSTQLHDPETGRDLSCPRVTACRAPRLRFILPAPYAMLWNRAGQGVRVTSVRLPMVSVQVAHIVRLVCLREGMCRWTVARPYIR